MRNKILISYFIILFYFLSIKLSKNLEFYFPLASFAPICFGEMLTSNATFSGHMYTNSDHHFNFYILD